MVKASSVHSVPGQSGSNGFFPNRSNGEVVEFASLINPGSSPNYKAGGLTLIDSSVAKAPEGFSEDEVSSVFVSDVVTIEKNILRSFVRVPSCVSPLRRVGVDAGRVES